jgi:hypothetical protein
MHAVRLAATHDNTIRETDYGDHVDIFQAAPAPAQRSDVQEGRRHDNRTE